jgi:MFS family permease
MSSTPPANSPAGTRRGRHNNRWLDLLVFFLADAQTGFGPFIAVHLTAAKWTQVQVGAALSLGTVVAMLCQVPGGAIVDAMRNKRTIAGAGMFAIGVSALLFAIWPTTLPVFAAQILHGVASSVVNPAIAAISLAVAGYVGFGERLGRNARFGSIGNGIAAAVMGVLGAAVSGAAVFWLTAALTTPAMLALARINTAPTNERPLAEERLSWNGLSELLRDYRVLVFACCALLFHLSNAAMLPLAAGAVAEQVGRAASLVIAACIVLPQAVVALVSPAIGRAANRWGRRPILLLGWAALPLRGLLMAPLPDPYHLVAIQVLSGVSAAVFGVMLPLIAADLTRRSGRFNLCLGIIGLAVSAGAALSTSLAGWLADHFGAGVGFVGLAAAGLAGTVLIGLGLPETRPAQLSPIGDPTARHLGEPRQVQSTTQE